MTRTLRRSNVAAILLLAALAPSVRAQVRWSGSASAGFVEHRVRDGGAIEATSGPVGGAKGSATLGSWVEMDAYLKGGMLRAEGATTSNQRMTETGAGVSAAALPWLALRAGVSRRSYVAAFAAQQWTALQLDAQARGPMLNGALHGIIRAKVMPLVRISGNQQRPNTAFGAETGLEWGRRRLTAGISYGVERYLFPEASGQTRAEQVSSLTVRFGLHLSAIPLVAAVRPVPSK